MSLSDLLKHCELKATNNPKTAAKLLTQHFSTPTCTVIFTDMTDAHVYMRVIIAGRWMNSLYGSPTPDAVADTISEAWANHTRITALTQEEAA